MLEKIKHYSPKLGIFLIALALIAGVPGCSPDRAAQYSLLISSSIGGTVTTPGEGLFYYAQGTVVNLVATPAAGYRFVTWTGNVDTIANTGAAITTITVINHYSVTASFDR